MLFPMCWTTLWLSSCELVMTFFAVRIARCSVRCVCWTTARAYSVIYTTTHAFQVVTRNTKDDIPSFSQLVCNCNFCEITKKSFKRTYSAVVRIGGCGPLIPGSNTDSVLLITIYFAHDFLCSPLEMSGIWR